MLLHIIGLGLASSLGTNVKDACAAHRAGINRPSEVTHFDILDESDGTMIKLMGYPALSLTEGFYLVGRWIRLAHAAVADLLQYAKLNIDEYNYWQKTGVIVLLPQIDDRYQPEEVPEHEYFLEHYVAKLLELCQLPISNEHRWIVDKGHAGTPYALELIPFLMEEQKLERILVIGADSYMEPSILEWLAFKQRLKTPENAMGLRPGEAGACVLIERGNINTSAPIQAKILACATHQETNDDFVETKCQGVALAQAIENTINTYSINKPFRGDLLSDINGEAWRAKELGSAIVKLGQKQIHSDVRLSAPTEIFGETGVASGLIAMEVSCRAFIRGYAYDNYTLISSSSENREVGCCLLAAPQLSPHY